MNRVFTLLLASFCPLVIYAQDLLERQLKNKTDQIKEQSTQPRVRTFRNGLSLSLSPGFTTGERGANDASIRFAVDAGIQRTCGRFNVYADIRQNFDELVQRGPNLLADVIEGELASSAWTTLCLSSPTFCELTKFATISSQAFARLNYDKCARIEESIESATRQGEALAIQKCLEEQQSRGVALGQAMTKCQTGRFRFTDLYGNPVSRIDVVGELTNLFKLDRESARDMELLLGQRRHSQNRFEGDADPAGGERRYGELKESYRKAWDEALASIRDGRKLSERDLAALLPFQDIRVIQTELNMLALLSREDQDLIKDSIVSRAALADLVQRLNRIERYLEAAMRMPALEESPARLDQYKRGREHVAREIERLRQEYAEKVATQQRYLEILQVMRARTGESASRVVMDASAPQIGKAKLDSLPEYGRYNPLGSYQPAATTRTTNTIATPNSSACCQTDSGFGRTK